MSSEVAEDFLVSPAVKLVRSLSSDTPTISSIFNTPTLLGDGSFHIQSGQADEDGFSSCGNTGYLTDTHRTARLHAAGREGTIEEEQWIIPPPPPPLDRSYDLLAVSSLPAHPTLYPEGAAQHIHGLVNTRPLFSLPMGIRRKIYSFCFPEETRRVTLSPRFATKAAFEIGYFASPWDVLEDVWGGLEACHALRNDLWVYFWTEFHFHITLNTLSGPKFSPLSHIWVKDRLNIIQHLTVEIDCTKFGGCYMESAPDSNYNMKKIELLLASIIKRLARRKDNSTISELNILCRRYTGFYPYIQRSFVDMFGPDSDPGCSNTVFHIGYVISPLRGILQKCRIAGFPPIYTKMLLSALFSDGDDQPEYTVPEEPAWPPLPLTSVSTSFSSTFSPSWTRSNSFESKWKEIPNLTKEFGRAPRNYEHESSSDSTSSSSGTTTANLGSDEEDGGNIDDLPPCEVGAPIPRWVWQYRDLVVSPFLGFENPNDRPSLQLESCSALSNTSQLFRNSSDDDPRNTAFGLGIERFRRSPTPKGPNSHQMNERNEQDPAFLRALNYLAELRASAAGPEAPRPSSVEPSRRPSVESRGPDDNSNSGAGTSGHGRVKQKSSLFLKRLRGKTA